ncbi:MAG: hypothetical protein V4694_06670 [Pseudomonadota bacterium]
MENFADYSGYVNAAYLIASLCLAGLMLFIVTNFFRAKSKIKNEKSA